MFDCALLLHVAIPHCRRGGPSSPLLPTILGVPGAACVLADMLPYLLTHLLTHPGCLTIVLTTRRDADEEHNGDVNAFLDAAGISKDSLGNV